MPQNEKELFRNDQRTWLKYRDSCKRAIPRRDAMILRLSPLLPGFSSFTKLLSQPRAVRRVDQMTAATTFSTGDRTFPQPVSMRLARYCDRIDRVNKLEGNVMGKPVSLVPQPSDQQPKSRANSVTFSGGRIKSCAEREGRLPLPPVIQRSLSVGLLACRPNKLNVSFSSSKV
jgi:hypothetical protein